MRLTKFGKAIGKGLGGRLFKRVVFGRKPISLAIVRTLVIAADHPHTPVFCSVWDGLETWVKVAQGTSPTYTASHDPQVRSREVHFGHRGREA
jgi:hypothetical protein